MGLSTEWSKHLKTQAERKEFERSVMGASHVLERLAQLIDEKMEGLDRAELSPSSYDNPSWAYKQSHMNGHRNGLTEVKKLLPS